MPSRSRISILDGLLLLMAIIWGTNYPIIKSAFRELQPKAFNALRLSIAATTFLVVMGIVRLGGRRRGSEQESRGVLASTFHTPARLTGSDWLALVALGVVGHLLYQYLFISGLARTSVANSSVIIAAAPVLIALIGAAIGQEHVGPVHWLGAGVSAFGIYLVVGQGMTIGGAGLTGDVMVAGAVCCWAAYTLGSRPLMERHSPVAVTGLSMAIGALLYLPLAWSTLRAVEWSFVSKTTVMLLMYSALFGLCLAYTIWYVGVRQIGSTRTSVYSNLVPLFAIGSAAIVLREPIGLRKAIGAIAVLAGVALTRVGGPRQRAPRHDSSPYAAPGFR